MPKKYPHATRTFVVSHLLGRKKRTVSQVVEFTGISRTTIWRWRNRRTKDSRPMPRSPKLAAAEPLIETLLRDALEDRGFECCLRTVYSTLKRIRYSTKRTKRQRSSKNSTPESKARYKADLNALQ